MTAFDLLPLCGITASFPIQVSSVLSPILSTKCTLNDEEYQAEHQETLK